MLASLSLAVEAAPQKKKRVAWIPCNVRAFLSVASSRALAGRCPPPPMATTTSGSGSTLAGNSPEKLAQATAHTAPPRRGSIDRSRLEKEAWRFTCPGRFYFSARVHDAGRGPGAPGRVIVVDVDGDGATALRLARCGAHGTMEAQELPRRVAGVARARSFGCGCLSWGGCCRRRRRRRPRAQHAACGSVWTFVGL